MASDLLSFTKHNPVSYLIHYVNDFLNYHKVGENRSFVRHAVNCYHQGVKVQNTKLPLPNEDVVVIPFFNPWEQEYVDELVSQKNVEERKAEVLKRREVALKREANKRLQKLMVEKETPEDDVSKPPANENSKEFDQTISIADHFMDIFGLHRTHPPQAVDIE